jgi:hypothetical protein
VVWVKSLVPYGYLIATLETDSRDRDGFSYLEGWVPDPDCPAMRHRVDYDTDTMELRIPRGCLHRPRAVAPPATDGLRSRSGTRASSFSAASSDWNATSFQAQSSPRVRPDP